MANIANMVVRIGAEISDAVSKLNAFQSRLTILQNQLQRLERIKASPGLDPAKLERVNQLISGVTSQMDELTKNTSNVTAAIGGFIGAAAGMVAVKIATELVSRAIEGIRDAIVGAKYAFTDLEIAAGKVKNVLEGIKTETDNLKKSLDFSTTIKSLQNTLRFGAGEETNILNLKDENANLTTFSDLVSDKINALESSISKAKKAFKFSDEVKELIKVFGGI